MYSKLQPINLVGEAVVTHLCDSSDEMYSTQRVHVAEYKN